MDEHAVHIEDEGDLDMFGDNTLYMVLMEDVEDEEVVEHIAEDVDIDLDQTVIDSIHGGYYLNVQVLDLFLSLLVFAFLTLWLDFAFDFDFVFL